MSQLLHAIDVFFTDPCFACALALTDTVSPCISFTSLTANSAACCCACACACAMARQQVAYAGTEGLASAVRPNKSRDGCGRKCGCVYDESHFDFWVSGIDRENPDRQNMTGNNKNAQGACIVQSVPPPATSLLSLLLVRVVGG